MAKSVILQSLADADDPLAPCDTLCTYSQPVGTVCSPIGAGGPTAKATNPPFLPILYGRLQVGRGG